MGKNFTVVKNRINLVDQKGGIVLQMERNSLFDYFETEKEPLPIPAIFTTKEKNKAQQEIEEKIRSVKNN
ncbi:MAG: hypothetical protein AAFZ15_32945 [Bacteroidota bacterium]